MDASSPYAGQSPDVGELFERHARMVYDHLRRVQWITVGTEPPAALPEKLTMLVKADLLGPLLDSRDLNVEVVDTRDRANKQLTLIVTSSPASKTMHGLKPTSSMRVLYTIDPVRWLPVRVSMWRKPADTPVGVVGVFRWVPDHHQTGEIEVPRRYRQLTPQREAARHPRSAEP